MTEGQCDFLKYSSITARTVAPTFMVSERLNHSCMSKNEFSLNFYRLAVDKKKRNVDISVLC